MGWVKRMELREKGELSRRTARNTSGVESSIKSKNCGTRSSRIGVVVVVVEVIVVVVVVVVEVVIQQGVGERA